MANFEVIIKIEDRKNVVLQLIRGLRVIDLEYLTLDRNLDTLLIVSIDKLLERNRINRLYLKSLKIRGKLDNGTVAGMVIGAFTSSLGT